MRYAFYKRKEDAEKFRPFSPEGQTRSAYSLIRESAVLDVTGSKWTLEDIRNEIRESLGMELVPGDIIAISYYSTNPIVIEMVEGKEAGENYWHLTIWDTSLKGKHRRISSEELARQAYDLVLAKGLCRRWIEIEDYFCPPRECVPEITDIEFDLFATPSYGSCEGIYIDLRFVGLMDSSDEKKTISGGTLKTLSQDMDGMLAAGEMCGALSWACQHILNFNMRRFCE